MYIISGCLLGHNCRYDGGNKRCEEVVKFCETHKYVTVCPESAGKLPSPRPPAEKVGSRILDKEGNDVTDNFLKGAQLSINTCFKIAELSNDPIEGAILKANSPSCGYGKVYDGTFTGNLKEGNGVFASMLSNRGVPIKTEKEIKDGKF